MRFRQLCARGIEGALDLGGAACQAFQRDDVQVGQADGAQCGAQIGREEVRLGRRPGG